MPRYHAEGPYERRVGLPPVVGDAPRVLILGTVPSVLSAKAQQYYGNPRNHFWRLVHDLLGQELADDYAERKGLLVRRGIALWDVISECEIIDSKDSTIRNEVLNDIPAFLREHPSIGHVFLNGRKAQARYSEMLRECEGGPTIPFTYLPSSSPLHAIPYQRKLEAWSVVRHSLG